MVSNEVRFYYYTKRGQIGKKNSRDEEDHKSLLRTASTMNNLSGRQLSAPAEAKYIKNGETHRIQNVVLELKSKKK